MINKLKIISDIPIKHERSLIIVYGIFIILFCNLPLKAQQNPQIIQDLSFGIFYSGSSGGTVTVPSVGSRTATGSVVLFTSDTGNPAILRVYLERKYRTYTITAGNLVDLTNGSGGMMELEINDFYPASPFVSGEIGDYDFNIGGTLVVYSPAISPGGNYSGSFEIIFNLQ